MDFESDEPDEDMRLATHLAEIESQYLPNHEARVTSHVDDDFAYALKLSEKLNSSTTFASESTVLAGSTAQSNSGCSSVQNDSIPEFGCMANDVDEDYLLAMKLAEEDSKDSPGRAEKVKIEDGFSDNEDYLLAVRLAEEESKDSSGRAEKVKIEDGFSDDFTNADYELALRLAREESTSSNGYGDSSSSVMTANGGQLSEPSFDSAISDHDLILSAQLFETDDSDVQIIEGSSAMATPILNRARKKKKNSPTETDSAPYSDQSMSVVDPSWETIDPNPDIYVLFDVFNKRFFWGRLDMVEVKWSPRMTLCAGICSYQKRAGHCVVKLSKPLLSYRPRKDLVETLLHEMIHAYLFVTKNDRDRDGHGPQFHKHMYRINKESGAKITVYHSFHDEVRMYKTHVWKCDGPCQNKQPFYGLVKRSMNRAPGPNDLWWAEHSASCGGKFHKIKEPENYGKKASKSAAKNENGKKQDISKFLSKSTASPSSSLTTGTSSSSTSGFNRLTSGSTSSTTSKTLNATPNFASNSSNSFPTAKKSSAPTFGGGAKIVTLSDLSKNARKRSPTKSSPTKSPKKWAPLPGQKNILSFIHK